MWTSRRPLASTRKQAHEGDAERAVRAGLELVEAVAALKAPVSLQTRVGDATGLVVVGEGGIRG